MSNYDLGLIIGLLAICFALMGLMLPESSFPSTYPYGNLTDVPQIPNLFDFRRSGITENRWYGALIFGTTALTYGIWSANNLLACPFLITKNMTFDTIAFRLQTTSTTGRIRLGIYNDTGNIYPSKLILDTGDIYMNVSGVRNVSINIILTPNLYWFTFLSNTSATIYQYPYSICFPILGSSSDISYDMYNTWNVLYSPYRELPITYPISANPTKTNEPVIVLRRIS